MLRSLNHPYMGMPYVDLDKGKLCFADNFLILQKDSNADISTKHAFIGNMIYALYEKILILSMPRKSRYLITTADERTYMKV